MTHRVGLPYSTVRKISIARLWHSDDPWAFRNAVVDWPVASLKAKLVSTSLLWKAVAAITPRVDFPVPRAPTRTIEASGMNDLCESVDSAATLLALYVAS